jgi:heat shock protein HslJ
MLKKTIVIVGMWLLWLTACTAQPTVTPTVAPPATATAVPTAAPTEKPAAVPPPTDELRRLRAHPWQWVIFDEEQINQPANYQLTFNTDASLSLVADCNTVAGSYQGEGGKLTLELSAATLAACVPESRSSQLIDLLPSATGYTFEGDNLVITVALESRPALLVFAPAKAATSGTASDTAAQALTANSWQWTTFEDSARLIEIEQPAHYRATFKPDSTLAVTADCNNASGDYQSTGEKLSIGLGATTRAECSPESRSSRFLEYLGAAVNYALEGENLVITVGLESSLATLTFAPTSEAAVGVEEATDTIAPEALSGLLSNLSYTGILPNQPITLTAGVGTYEDGKSSVRLVDHLIALGDLNADGVQDAVIVLEDESSGSGRFVYLVPVLNTLRQPAPLEAALLGDRVNLKSLAIVSSEVVADVIAPGPGEPACCGSWNVRKVFALQDDHLAERSSDELSQMSLADLNGTQWRLADLNANQEAPLTDTEITLSFAGGQLSGSAGCNTTNATVSGAAGRPASFVVGPIATTKKLCPEPVMKQEASYLARLSSVTAWGYRDGRLRLNYESPETGHGTLLFESTGNSFAAVPFDLGDAVVVQDWVSIDSMRNLPVRLNGMIAIPPTGDNRPLAVIIHGSHGTGCRSTDGINEKWPCPDIETPHYAGFAYLLQALAADGYVAVSINANPAFAMAYGGASPNERLPVLVDLYLEKIAAAAKGEDVGFGADLSGRVNLNQTVALGHSAGGEGLTHVIDDRAGHTLPDQISAGQGPLAAAILLAPSKTESTIMDLALPLTVILPACDRDVANLVGQLNYDQAGARVERTNLAASVYLPGANHNRFNTGLGDEALGTASSVCGGAWLPAAAQRAFLADYAVNFYDAALGRGDGVTAALNLDPAQPVTATLFDRAVLTSLTLPTSQRLRLPLSTTGATGAATAVWCEAGFGAPGERPDVCRRVQFNQPGDPAELALAWDGANGAYQVAVPQAERDLSDYAALHLRAVVDPINPLNETGQPQALSVRLTDGVGQTAAVVLKGEPALAFPIGKKGFNDHFKLDTWDNHVVLSSIRVPLSEFSGIDLSNVQSVALVFDQTDRGAIFMTDLEFLKARPE